MVEILLGSVLFLFTIQHNYRPPIPSRYDDPAVNAIQINSEIYDL